MLGDSVGFDSIVIYDLKEKKMLFLGWRYLKRG